MGGGGGGGGPGNAGASVDLKVGQMTNIKRESVISTAATMRVINVLRHWVSKHYQVNIGLRNTYIQRIYLVNITALRIIFNNRTF